MTDRFYFRLGRLSLGAALVATAVLAATTVRAEGSGQLGRVGTSNSRGLYPETILFVEVLPGDTHLNIAARSPSGAALSVNVTDPAGTQTSYALNSGNGLLSAATVPATLPNGSSTVRSIAVTPGLYRVQFSVTVDPFDITVTQALPTVGTPFNTSAVPAGGGRLYSKDWRFFAEVPGGSDVDFSDADFYVRSPVGDDFEYIWKLDFEGLLGGQMCLVANNLGLPGEFARSSQSFETIQTELGGTVDKFSLCDDLSGFSLYVNPPNNPKPRPQAPVLEYQGIGQCGAVLEGSGGLFAFNASLPATYELVIDADDNGTVDGNSGDLVLSGAAEAGPNSIVWDGLGPDGQPLPADIYKAKLYLRLGEFHFTASDVEGIDPGVAVLAVDPNTSAETGTQVYWDDTDLDNSTGTPANPVRATPNGVASPAGRHGWVGAAAGQVDGLPAYTGPGENAYVDTWAFGAETGLDFEFTVYSPSVDTDGDGLNNGRECSIGSLFDNVDTDNDGVSDGFEAAPSGTAVDTDGDTVPDVLDDDDDDDGIPTAEEQADPDTDNDPSDGRDTDGNGIPDYLQADDDGDGIPTAEERPDPNQDGSTTDGQDSDGDGDPDFLDVDDDGDSIPTADELPDPDQDGDPADARDTNGDNIPDYLDDDDDGDGIPTQQEVDDAADSGEDDLDGDGDPNWLDTDSDGDGIDDAEEAGTDQNNNGIPDYLEPPQATDAGAPDAGSDPGANAEAGAASDAGATADSDGDGIPDAVECPSGTCPDSNGDGTTDEQDADDDGDGIPTRDELTGSGAELDTDNDGKPNHLDTDDDDDGISTAQELADALRFGNDDVDNDGKKNWLDTDSDGDGAPDETENVGNGDANDNDVPDYLESGTAPADADLDGVPDATECVPGTACPDSDGDATPDYLDADDDGDGIPTSDEVNAGAPKDTDGDGIPDHLDTDDDGDNLPTASELTADGAPKDTDGDGKPDYLDSDDDQDRVPTKREVRNGGKLQDTDGDGKPDHLDTDDDGDGKLTTNELGNVNSPRDSDGDGIADYLDPSDGAVTVEGGGFRCAMGAGSSTRSSAGWLLLVLGLVLSRRNWRQLRRGAPVAAGLALALLLSAPRAMAQQSGFALNHYEPAERGSDWFWGESLDLRGSGRFAIGLVADWARKPLVTYDQDGNEFQAIVRDQVFGHVGASVNIADRLRIGANIPVLMFQDGESATVDGVAYRAKSGANLGDLRFGLDIRLVGEYGGPATLVIGGQLFVPTGARDAYVGDGQTRFVPRLALAGDIASFAYSARVGVALRGQRQDFAGQAFGTDAQFGATAGLRLLDKALLIGPEVWGSTVVSDAGDGFMKRRTTPVEAVLSAHYFANDWRFGVGAGPGFTSGFGSPAVRILASVEWFPAVEKPAPPPPPDTDGDGILDSDDACPDVPGVVNYDRTKHGCPVVVPKDTDKDGIIDDEDACVTVAGVANADKAKHGCPPDADGDGILDSEDACINEPGEPNTDRSKHGCPKPVDADGDGIFPPEDACPSQAGPADPDSTKNGCPRVQVTEERVIILDRIEFDVDRATIRHESDEILGAVYKVITENPQLTLVRIEGHTDNRGSRAHNLDLSKKRARSVVQWLVNKGVAENRLVSVGFGPDRPVDSNDTDTGRQNNRRVEFHIASKADASKAE